jgi:hypothetical protein
MHTAGVIVAKSPYLIDRAAGSSDFRNRTAFIKTSIAALNGLVSNHVGHKHSAVKKNDVGARWNTFCRETPARAVITDTAGFPFLGNQKELPAPIAHEPISHWHFAIMLRRNKPS